MAQKMIDLTGIRFGLLIVTVLSHRNTKGKLYWKCICDCGNTSVVRTSALRAGKSKSCGRNFFYEKDGYMVGVNHNGQKFFFDKQDYELIKSHTWTFNDKQYLHAKINNKNISLHRLLLNPDKNQEIDHRNHDPSDNRRQNLRVCSKNQNQRNRSYGYGRSKYKGVSFKTREGKWCTQAKFNKKSIFLGYFDSEIDAAVKYNEFAAENYGEFAYLNDV